MKYRDFLTLTDEEIKFIVKEMFNTSKISDIRRDEEEREIVCTITTDGWNDGESENFSIEDELILKQPTLYSPGIFIDFAVGAEEKKKWRQFCLAKGCNAFLENNPYLED